MVLGPVEEEDGAMKWSPRGLQSMQPLLEPSQGLDLKPSPRLAVKIGPGVEAKSEDGLSPEEEARAGVGASLKERGSHVTEAGLESKRVMENADLGPRIAGGLVLENGSVQIRPRSRLIAARSVRSLTASQTRLRWPVQ